MISGLIKYTNLFNSGFSYLKSTITGDPTVSEMPVSIGVELTNHCNLQCAECSSGAGIMSRERGFMQIELYEKLISELQPYLINVNLYFQGEPMLHPLFFSFLGKSSHLHTTVSTNGHFLSVENSERLVRSGLSGLIISLDGIDQATYSSYRKNGNVHVVQEGIKNICLARKKYRSDIIVEIQVLVNRNNENQIPDLRKLARRSNARLRLKSMQILEKESIDKWLPRKSTFRRYENFNGEYKLKSSFPNRCLRLWVNPVITWDGKVIPCCFDKDAEHIMGDINYDSLKNIWNGNEFRSFRKSVLSGRDKIGICRNCTSGLKGVRN